MKLRDMLMLYNFRYYREDLYKDWESKAYDTQVIRIYLKDDITRNNKYIEFGVYDFSEDDYKLDIIENSLNEKILDTKVSCIYYDDQIEIFCIMLEPLDDES